MIKKIICLYGGPGSGKSTTCAGLFYQLKLQGFNCEMNREYIKDWVWENREVKEGDQTYFFAKQSRKERMYILKELDYVITDSPLVLTHFYGTKYDPYEQTHNTSLTMLKHHHAFCKEKGYKTDHIFLERVKPYQSEGRFQDEEGAKQIDREILEMLDRLEISYLKLPGNESAIKDILTYIKRDGQ